MQILLSDDTALPNSVPFDLKALKEALLKALEKDDEAWKRKEPLSVWWRFFHLQSRFAPMAFYNQLPYLYGMEQKRRLCGR